jgi:hypothetical protein
MMPLSSLTFQDGRPFITWSSARALAETLPTVDADMRHEFLYEWLWNPDRADQAVDHVPFDSILRTPGLLAGIIRVAGDDIERAYLLAQKFEDTKEYQEWRLEQQQTYEHPFEQFVNSRDVTIPTGDGSVEAEERPAKADQTEQPDGDDTTAAPGSDTSPMDNDDPVADDEQGNDHSDDVPPPATDSGWKSRTTPEGSYYYHPDGWVTEWHRNVYVAGKALERGEVVRVEVETETEDS